MAIDKKKRELANLERKRMRVEKQTVWDNTENFISSNNYIFLKNFVKKHGNNYNSDKIFKFQKLMELKGYPLSEV